MLAFESRFGIPSRVCMIRLGGCVGLVYIVLAGMVFGFGSRLFKLVVKLSRVRA